MTTAKEYVEKYTELGNKYKALEAKHKQLRGNISWLAQELRELPAEEDGWPEVPSFGIYKGRIPL